MIYLNRSLRKWYGTSVLRLFSVPEGTSSGDEAGSYSLRLMKDLPYGTHYSMLFPELVKSSPHLLLQQLNYDRNFRDLLISEVNSSLICCSYSVRWSFPSDFGIRWRILIKKCACPSCNRRITICCCEAAWRYPTQMFCPFHDEANWIRHFRLSVLPEELSWLWFQPVLWVARLFLVPASEPRQRS